MVLDGQLRVFVKVVELKKGMAWASHWTISVVSLLT